MKLKHSLVVPCYNEEGNVEKFLDAAKKAMQGYTDSYELVFVNDGSSDKTPEKLRKLFNENKDVKIKVISISRNFGKESAMFAGLYNAKGDYVAIMDADMQDPPSLLPQMIKILREKLFGM